MINSKHTPGPWKVVHFPCDHTELLTEDGSLLLAVSDYAVEEDEQNFTLMAASPDLYKALQGLLDCQYRFLHKAVENAQKALDKAEGK